MFRTLCRSKLSLRSNKSTSAIRDYSTQQIPFTGDASTVARGTAFEHSSALLLQRRFGIQLQRVGGAGDRGIDLRGWWYVPLDDSTKRNGLEKVQVEGESRFGRAIVRKKRLRVIAQCKAEAKKLGPVIIREFEGTLHRAELQDRLNRNASTLLNTSSSSSSSSPPLSSSSPEIALQGDQSSDSDLSQQESDVFTDSRIIGVLLSSSGFSKQSALQAMSSPSPLLLIHLEAPDPKLHSSLTQYFQKQDIAPFGGGSTGPHSGLESISSRPTTDQKDSKPKRKKKVVEAIEEAEKETEIEDQPNTFLETPVCFSVLANQAFLSRNGPLQGRIEIRWERIANSSQRSLEENGRPIIYWNGKRIEENNVKDVFGISI